MNFRGKVILITGASSGIGAATAKHFAQFNASLALAGRNLANLKQVASDCKAISCESPFIFTGDLTNEEETRALIESVLNHYTRLDILVNNAATAELGSIEDTSLAQYDRVLNTNVRSVYHLTMLAVPHLIRTKGSIINVSSVSGLRPSLGFLAYCTSKAAIDQFTRSLALELADKGVRVNSVSPGVILTGIHKRAGMNDAAYAEFLQKAEKIQPLGRVGTAQEVATVIAFLASENASFLTGVITPVDGGRHI